ncbi:MAG: hypothetical protein IPO48_19180 [Saprospiraceae bacterium]|nr:hypothetical protein [Saprospiraceae bacterium]
MSFNASPKFMTVTNLLTKWCALETVVAAINFKITLEAKGVENLRIAVPGYNTTAFLLLKYALPKGKQFQNLYFSGIENAVLTNEQIRPDHS